MKGRRPPCIRAATFDRESMHFHLPAFMLAELDGTFGFGLCFHLDNSSDSLFTLRPIRPAR